MAWAWLAAHAETVAAAGRPALDAVLRLAADRSGIIAPAQVRVVLARDAAGAPGEPGGPGVGWTLRLAAGWACAVPLPERDGDWITVVEVLLTSVVDAEHVEARHRRAPAEHAALAAPWCPLRPRGQHPVWGGGCGARQRFVRW
ncbi:hypothetical protein ACIQVO_35975 [Streptomyces sp. NPDC101062]|uniref:hypothetical protein n=1 Tax=unclassified Streptomyces TaxID=2593676 RepID=UPI0038269AC3